jgi:hypothetical protein
MGVLEILAEKQLGVRALRSHAHLRQGLNRLDRSRVGKNGGIEEAEKCRIASIAELFFEYGRESDPAERRNILRTLEEIVANKPLELPRETVEEWEKNLDNVRTKTSRSNHRRSSPN